MKQLRNKAVEQKTLSSPLRMATRRLRLVVAGGGRPGAEECETLTKPRACRHRPQLYGSASILSRADLTVPHSPRLRHAGVS